MSQEINRKRLYHLGNLSIFMIGLGFAVRANIAPDLQTDIYDQIDLVNSATMVGEALGITFTGFALTLLFGSALVDLIGMKRMLLLSALGYIAGAVGLFVASSMPVGDAVQSLVLMSLLFTGLGWGAVEAASNPMVSALYPEEKTHRLNILHAWWPAGIVVGGLIGLALSSLNLPWELNLLVLLIPSLVLAWMVATSTFPVTERVAEGVSYKEMLMELFKRPLYWVFWVAMFATAAAELAQGQWVNISLSNIVGMQGIILLVYVSVLMFVMRHFAGPIVERISSIGLMFVSCLMAGIGLYVLSLANSPLTAFAAATIWGIGVCYMWPTMLAIVAERFTRGGALAMGLMGFAGGMSIQFVLPQMGAIFDSAKAEAAGGAEKLAGLSGEAMQEVIRYASVESFQSVAVIPLILLPVFGLIWLYDRKQASDAYMRIIVGLLTLLLSLPLFAQEAQSASEQALPNIIIILADDMGYADMGVFGAEGIETPHLDQMAANGMQFTDFYSPSPVCSPTRAALMTGRYAKRHGMTHVFQHTSHDGMDPEEVTIAEQLKQAGYSTGMVGKWHLGHLDRYMPWNQGFKEFYGVPFSNDMGNFFWYENQEIIYEPIDQRYLTKRYTEKATDYIERHQDKPFLLYLAHSMPHVPLYVSPEFEGSSELGLYGDVIQELDWSTGEIVKKLEALGIAENTLVLFSSDNGPWLVMDDHGGSAGELRSGKGSTFEGGQRVPTVAQWPAQISPGSVNGTVSSLLDILPTVSSIAGVPLPENKVIDGKDILPVLNGTGERADQQFIYLSSHGSHVQGLRDGDWKLKRPQSGYPQFLENWMPAGQVKHETLVFNLKEDPSEQNNLADQYPQRVEQMELQLQAFEASVAAENARSKYVIATKSDKKGYEAVVKKGAVLLIFTLLGIYIAYRFIKKLLRIVWRAIRR